MPFGVPSAHLPRPITGLKSVRRRLGLAAIGAIYLGLAVQAFLLAFGVSRDGGGDEPSDPRPVVATMLRWPVGSELVGLAAAGFIIGGLVLLLWGWLHQYEDELEGRAMSHPSFVVTRVAGIVGDSVRGLLLVLIGRLSDDRAR